jgi:hypothetical protein
VRLASVLGEITIMESVVAGKFVFSFGLPEGKRSRTERSVQKETVIGKGL